MQGISKDTESVPGKCSKGKVPVLLSMHSFLYHDRLYHLLFHGTGNESVSKKLGTTRSQNDCESPERDSKEINPWNRN